MCASLPSDHRSASKDGPVAMASRLYCSSAREFAPFERSRESNSTYSPNNQLPNGRQRMSIYPRGGINSRMDGLGDSDEKAHAKPTATQRVAILACAVLVAATLGSAMVTGLGASAMGVA